MKREKAIIVAPVWAVMKTEDDPINPGKKMRVAIWGNRPPLNGKQKYEWFSSFDAFDDHCTMNNITARKI